MTRMTISYKPHYPKAADGQRVVQERQQQRDSSACPASVRRAEFIRRNLTVEIAAGRCTVTRKTYLETIVIVDLIHRGGNYYIAILADGRQIQSGEWEGELTVIWTPKPDQHWCSRTSPHPLDVELHASLEPAFTWQRHPAAVYYKPE